MTILIENEVDAKFDFDYEDIAKKVINTSMDLLKFPFFCSPVL